MTRHDWELLDKQLWTATSPPRQSTTTIGLMIVAVVARFRQVNLNQPAMHHDALEFPDGKIVLVTDLCEGQCATVLQLPSTGRPATEPGEQVVSERASLIA
jgi:hypothetical protein